MLGIDVVEVETDVNSDGFILIFCSEPEITPIGLNFVKGIYLEKRAKFEPRFKSAIRYFSIS